MIDTNGTARNDHSNERTGETVHRAVMQGGELVTLAVLDSHHAVRVVSALGGKSNAAHATATGKAILAWLPDPEIERIIERRGLMRFTDKTIVDRLELLENLRHVRRNGFANGTVELFRHGRVDLKERERPYFEP